MRSTTNGLAIASLVCAFLFTLLGVVFGHIALHQIKRSGGWQTGRGIAIAGLVLSYLFLGVTVALWIALVAIANSAP